MYIYGARHVLFYDAIFILLTRFMELGLHKTKGIAHKIKNKYSRLDDLII